MLVFLIEDDAQKAEQISSFLRSLNDEVRLEVLGSYQSGLKAIERGKADLVILDMNLPTFDNLGASRGGRPRALGGYEIMRKMKRKGINVPTLVITQLESFGDGDDKVSFGEIVERCSIEFPTVFLGGVYYSRLSNAWQDGVKDLIQNLIGAKNA